MIATSPSRERLEEMLMFAAASRGWNNKQLGEALRRDPASIIPQSGTPKIDLIVRLANVLDWSLSDLIEHLSGPPPRTITPATAAEVAHEAGVPDGPRRHPRQPDRAGDAQLLHELRARAAGADPESAIELADSVRLRADDASSRVEAALVLAELVDRRGRPMRALAVLQHAALETDLSVALHLETLARLADAHHRTGQPIEARGIAVEALALVERLDAASADQPRTRFAVALAEHVRAACLRDAVLDAHDHRPLDADTRAALDRAAAATRLASDVDESRRLAMTIEAGAAAVDAITGRRRIDDVITETLSRLDAAVDPSTVDDRPLLLGLGWWCVLTGRAALRTMPDGPEMHRALAILTNKGDELSAAVDCWALRERVIVLEHGRRCRLAAFTGEDEPWLLDREDLGRVIGCMGASRRFRPLGERILRRAIVVRETER